MRIMKPLAAGTLVVVVGIVLLLPACGNTKRFDSATWLTGDARERGRMSQDLVDSRVLNGSSIEQAKQLLGEPQKDWGRVVQYHIDLGWPLKDPEHYGLQLHLNSSRRITGVRIVD